MTTLRKHLALFLIAFLLVSSYSLLSISAADETPSSENAWVSKMGPPQYSIGLKAASVDGKIYFLGNSVNFEFNPTTNNWTSKTPMPTPRAGFGLVVYQNKIFTVGGSLQWTEEDGYVDSAAIEVYDPTNDTWKTKIPMPMNRSFVGAAVVDGKIHLIGSQTHDVYDIALQTWSEKEGEPFEPYYGYGYDSSTTVLDNKIYVIIGNKTQIYDTRSNQWRLGAALPTPVIHAAICSTTGELALKRVYVIGGTTGEGGMFASGVNLIQVYDPKNDSWTLGEAMPTARLGLSAAVAHDKIYALSGRTTMAFSGELKVNEEYTPFGYGTSDPTYITPNESTPVVTNQPTELIELNPFFAASVVAILVGVATALAVTTLLLYHKNKAKKRGAVQA